MPESAQPVDDGQYIPTVGQWSSDKHYYLSRYMGAFTTSMREKWGTLHYVDLFAGAGIERLKESKALEWGSPILAARTRFPFSRLHLCDMKGHPLYILIFCSRSNLAAKLWRGISITESDGQRGLPF